MHLAYILLTLSFFHILLEKNCDIPVLSSDLFFLCMLVVGVSVGRLRVYYQPYSPACVCVAADATLQQKSLHR